MLAIVKPFVLSALRSPKFKTFVVELLEKLVEQIDFTRNFTINSTTTSLSVFSQ